MVIKLFKTASCLLLLLTFLTGFLYPFTITGLAQILFPWQANGSLIKQNDKIIGSKWIGQSFTSPDFFHGRSSSISSSNLALTNPLFIKTIQMNMDHLHELNPNNQERIPMDLVTSSASGLDPDISPIAALYQVPRVAKARNISNDVLINLIHQKIIPPFAGFIGEPRVNVLALNIAMLSITNPGIHL